MKVPKHIRAIRDTTAKRPVICPENAIARINKISDVLKNKQLIKRNMFLDYFLSNKKNAQSSPDQCSC